LFTPNEAGFSVSIGLKSTVTLTSLIIEPTGNEVHAVKFTILSIYHGAMDASAKFAKFAHHTYDTENTEAPQV
jgi:hypothetical protein